MQYKTIALELIQEQPELYEQLRSSKRLLPAMDAYAIELKASHEAWKDQLGQAKPGSDPSQIASEAMELAIQELQGPFALRVAGGRSGAAVARRGDEFPPPTYAARVRPARGQPPLPMFGPPPRQPPPPRRPPSRIPPAIPFLPAPAPPGPSSATLQPQPPAATGQTAFTTMIFQRVNLPFLRCAGTGGTMPPVGKRPAWRLLLAPGKAPAGGAGTGRRRPHHGRNRHDHRTARHRQRRESQGPRHPRRHPHPASRSSRSTARPPPMSGRRSPASAASGPWPCRSFPIRSPAATRTPAGRPSATS